MKPVLSRLDPTLLALGVLAVGLATAPWIAHRFDLRLCFLGWARATEGARPWEVYDARLRGFAPVDCDYPPVVPYLLTIAERVRRAVGAEELGGVAVLLVKLPSLLVWAAGIPLCFRILRGVAGEAEARAAAALCALCLPIFVNAAVWGQFDGMVAVLLLLAVCLLLAGRTVAAGAVLGLGLATKLLVVAMLPAAAVWTLRRHGARRLAGATLAGVLAVGAAAAPYFVHGHGRPVVEAYSSAVGYYPRRTIEAYNIWFLLDRIEGRWSGVPMAEVRLDTRPVAGPLTSRGLGLLAFAAYLAYLCAVLWRRPEDESLVLAASLSMFAFFMLPTQIHGRYLVAAVAILAAAAVRSRTARILFIALSVSAALGQGVELWRSFLEHWNRVDPDAFPDIQRDRALVRGAAVALSIANVAVFAWATRAFARDAVRPTIPGRPAMLETDAVAALLDRAARGPGSLHQRFGDIDDETWLALILLGQEGRPELRGVLPGFPEDAPQIQSTGASGPHALRQAFPIYRLFKGLHEQHRGPLAACERVLDFGCGWGRILRFFLKDVEADRLWGIDTRDKMIDVCRRTLPGCHFERAGPWPPTPRETASVDFVYAFSVFSHLSEAMHTAWLSEFHRILKPGGLLIVSTRNRGFIEVCEGFRAQADLAPHLSHLRRLFPDAARSLQAFDDGQYCYDAILGNWWTGEACIPRGYVESHWTRFFTPVDYIDDPARCEQNVIVVRR